MLESTQMDKLFALTQAVLSEANRQRVSVGAVRLVKLLYLVEVEVCQHHGHRVTDATWRYYLYGPFPDEFRTLERSANLIREDVPITQNRIFHSFSVDEERTDYAGVLTWDDQHFIPSLVRRWGDASLNSLLNHVYFHTAPMQAAKERGEILDFSTMRLAAQPISGPQREPSETKIDRNKVHGLFRRFVNRELARARSRPLSPRRDQIYLNTLEALDKAERIKVRGEIEINEAEFPDIASQK